MTSQYGIITMNPRQQYAHDFAQRIHDLGFAVYLAEDCTYGFVTDSKEDRVLCFSARDGSLGGTYGPPSQRSGTGWRMAETMADMKTAEDVVAALHAYPPPYCLRGENGWQYFTTVAQYMKMYGPSSKFVRWNAE